MKKCRIYLYSLMLPYLLTNYLYGQENPLESAVVEMTPQQLDDSLRIDSQELELDNALGIDLGSEIESLENISEPLPLSPTEAAPSLKEYAPEPEKRPERLPHAPIIVTPKNNSRLLTSVEQEEPLEIFNEPTHFSDEEEKIEFQFEEADLQSLLKQVATLFNVTFITDDAINPLPKNGKSIKGNKISFKTNKPLNRAQAWNLFLSFLSLVDMAVVPEADPSVLRIMQTVNAQRAPIPSYLGVRPETLPDSDQLIRYLYFVENSSLETIKNIVNALRSSASALLELKDLNAFVITDKALNIKSLMSIVSELDKATMPQAMSVLKLKRVNAEDVQKLYASLIAGEDASVTARLFPGKKGSSALYFPEDTRIIAEPRTNALILLGHPESIKKIEDFIIKHVDIELGAESLSPLRIYPLKYADAQTVAAIMNETVQFGKNTIAGKTGGVRDNDKYIKSLVFIAEPATNKLIIKGDEEDFLQAKEIIARLDEPQPQVAIEVLLVGVDLTGTKELGAQIRSKDGGITSGLFGPNVKFQTSNINNIIVNPLGQGVQRLLGNLLTLITEPNSTIGQGSTVVTFGSDTHGVWGLFNALETVVNAQVISNPYLIATNKQAATVSVGENRRVVTNQVITATTPQNSFSDLIAALTVKITPQINSDGMIVMDIDIDANEFTNAVNQNDATMRKRNIKTTTIIADKEVLALGGLIRNKIDQSMAKTPILANIPIIGWLFKDRRKEENKQNLLILISANILPPETPQRFTESTQQHIKDYYGTIDEMKDIVDNRDPIHRFFFAEKKNSLEQTIEDFIFERRNERQDAKKKRDEKRKKRKKALKADAAALAAATPPAIPSQVSAQTVTPVSLEQKAPVAPPNTIEAQKKKKQITDFLQNKGSDV